MDKGQFTFKEITSQSEAWAGALREVEALNGPLSDLEFRSRRQILFSGCGSTYYLSLAAASLFQRLVGVRCQAVPGGELFMCPEAYYQGQDNLLIAISRSGATSETVNAAERFQQEGAGLVLSLSTVGDSRLAQLADLKVSIREGQERSVAQTRAWTSMYLAAVAIALVAADRQAELDAMNGLPETGKTLIERYQDFARELAEAPGYDRFFFLGSGDRYGIACEANLKMKEMAITHTEPFHFLEFRHGPISMVDQKSVVLGLVSEEFHSHEERVLAEASALGARVVSLAEAGSDIAFASKLPETVRNVLYLPVLQLTAYFRSLHKGLDPDQPKNLSAVVLLS